jgi:cation diffusion facilitator family transporter
VNVESPPLHRFTWIAISAAVITLALKFGAWLVTDSVGLLSDALESLVNLVGALGALLALWYASREPDAEHEYGHAKAEYFSSGLEGALILLAAASIAYAAIPRITEPAPVESAWLGVSIAIVATVVNLVAATWIRRAANRYHSVALSASSHHLLADVVTTSGVVLGVGVIQVTGWNRLDPIIALLVALNIIRVGLDLVRRSMLGLLDTALPVAERQAIEAVLARHRASEGIEAHALRTRQAGQRRFGSVHILVPGKWSVQRGHMLLDRIEQEIGAAVPGIMLVTHLESLEDPRSWEDETLP